MDWGGNLDNVDLWKCKNGKFWQLTAPLVANITEFGNENFRPLFSFFISQIRTCISAGLKSAEQKG